MAPPSPFRPGPGSGPLNTQVNGSSGTCEDLAAWLDDLGTGAMQAADGAQAARGNTASGWWGPAASVFFNVALHVRDTCDDLLLTCTAYANALRDFAGSLQKVTDTMKEVLASASAASLTIEGPFIHPPDPASVGSEPEKGADKAAYDKAVTAYNTKVEAYNAKAAVFNDCSDRVKEARKIETEAHAALTGTINATPDDLDLVPVGTTNVGALLAGIGSGHDAAHTKTSAAWAQLEADTAARQALLKDLSRVEDNFSTFKQLALGERIGEPKITPAQRQMLMHAALRAGSNREALIARVEQYDQLMKSEKYLRDVKLLAANPADAAAAKRIFKSLPFVGAGLTAVNEAYGAIKGEQTILASAVKAGTEIGAGTILGMIASRAGAAAGLLGLLGGYAATVGAEMAVKHYLPDHVDIQYNQPKVEELAPIHRGMVPM